MTSESIGKIIEHSIGHSSFKPCIERIGFPSESERGVLSPKLMPVFPCVRAHQGESGNLPRYSECVIARAPSLRCNDNESEITSCTTPNSQRLEGT
jgi:hypothetical protein